MGLVIKTLAQREAERVAAAMKSDRRLYLSADKQRVVEEGDPDAAFLFAGVGGEILPDDANRYGLAYKGGKVLLPRQQKAAQVPENKAVGAPEGDKGTHAPVLEDMNKDELLAEAKRLAVEVAEKATKAEIIAALVAAVPATNEPGVQE